MHRLLALVSFVLLACGSDGFRIPGDLRVAVTDAEFGGEPATHVEGYRRLDEAHLIDSVVFRIETAHTEHEIELGSAVLRRALMGDEVIAWVDGEPRGVRASWHFDPNEGGSQDVELQIGSTNTFDAIRLEVWPVDRERARRVEVERRPEDPPTTNEEDSPPGPPDWVLVC